MTKRMLIDSTHAEETRVVVLDGNRLEDFDVETSTKQQLKGNIYLAKVVRVEPSLQAAFVEYGGGRHGFLAFGEIHPDYYQIPVADRQRLLEMQEAEAREDEDAEDRAAARDAREIHIAAAPPATNGAGTPDGADTPDGIEDAGRNVGPDVMDAITDASYAVQADPEAAKEALPRPDQVAQAAAIAQDILVAPHEAETLFADDVAPAQEAIAAPWREEPTAEPPDEAGADMAPESNSSDASVPGADVPASSELGASAPELSMFDGPGVEGTVVDGIVVEEPAVEAAVAENGAADAGLGEAVLDQPSENGIDHAEPPESINGESEEPREQRAPPRFLRNYKIQEVIRRRQILLIQVVKEERGTKGAALTTYISLAGRFSVLMPNSPRGGGISRKITSAADRRRLKEVTAELDLPRGMGLIVRTAGANRPKPEIIRDCEYLLNQWDQIRDLTMNSVAPALIYEEASLIKRAIRDVYSRDVDDILVDGEQGWRAARDFMRMLMPTHARKVQLWKDPQPLFVKAQVEAQLDAMLLPTVQLKSGGYLVINQTEALVAIDVNSGRSTRERGIEETALKTNMEAAEEAARQLRLRDLAGLIVIDFIDMESRRNIASVEKRLKDALKIDRARIQVGSISPFGLMEMSRQRLRPSLAETSLVMCTHCAGTGQVRSTESAALHVLRAVEEEGAKRRAAEIVVHVAGSIALYVLNHKRVRLAEIETRYGMRVAFAADDMLLPPNTRIERVRAQAVSELPAPISQLAPPEPFEDPDEESMDRPADTAPVSDEGDDDEAPRPGETAEEGEQRSRRRRRRRRGGRREDGVADIAAQADLAVTGPETTGPETTVPETTVPEPAGVEAAEAVATGAAAVDPGPSEVGSEPAVQPESIPDVGDAIMEALTIKPAGDDAPAVADTAAPENTDAASDDADRSKRRGRRGGRRRRREPGDAPATSGSAEGSAGEPGDETRAVPVYTPPVYAPPAYVGPTPADPFGGTSAFDIFDAIEQAEQERALAATVSPRRAPEAPAVEPPIEEMQREQPVQDAPSEPEPVTMSVGNSDPVVGEPKAEAQIEAEAQPKAEPAVGPLIVPTLIDGADTLTDKKRGWWRR